MLFLSAPSDASDAATKNAQTQAVYEIETKKGRVEIRYPETLGFHTHVGVARVPARSLIRLTGDAEARLLSSFGGEVLLRQEGTFELPPRGQISDSWGRRVIEASGDVPLDDVPPEDPRIKKILAFFFGKTIPPESRASVETQKKTVLHPIKIVAPPTVKLIETTTFPLTIALEWTVAPGQLEPHKVFVWSEHQMTYSPYSVTEGGKTTIQINEHGKFFWQIEDASGTHASIPRTLLVRSPTPPEPADKKLGKKFPSSLTFLRPNSNSLFYFCFEKEDATLPLWFLHKNPNFIRYHIKLTPDVGTITKISPTSLPGEMFAELKMKRPGQFEAQVLAFEDAETTNISRPMATSLPLLIRVENHCGKLAAAPFLAPPAKPGTNSTFEQTGSLYFRE